MVVGDMVSYVGSSLVGFGEPGVVIGTLGDKAEVMFTSKTLRTESMFGSSTNQYSCLINLYDLVNISQITGEPCSMIGA